MKVTPCECERAGWCARHRCEKPWALVELCRRRPAWFDLWERGEGPGQTSPRPSTFTHRPACVQRREVVRREACSTCAGRVELFVWSCAVHGECTVLKAVPGLACCATCGDFQSDPNRVDGSAEQAEASSQHPSDQP